MNVRAQTNLVKRGNVYYFRKKIPADLRVHFNGRESLRESLRTFPTLAEAKREAGRRAAQYEAEFAKLRHAAEPMAAVPLTLELIPQITEALQAHILAADDEIRVRGMGAWEFDFLSTQTAEALQEARTAYARGQNAHLDDLLSEWLAGLNIEMEPGSEAGKLLRRKFLEAKLKALQAQARRDEGEIIDTPRAPCMDALREQLQAPHSTPLLPALDSTAPRLADVVDYWKTTSPKAPRTLHTAETVVRSFVALHGDLPLAEISKAHFVALRDKYLETVQPATVQARFNLLKGAFTVCLEDDKFGVTANPLQHVKIRKGDIEEKARDAFPPEALQTLFDSPVFTGLDRPRGGKGETAFWAPLIALFTGARLDEILNLRTDGICQRDGIWVLHFQHRPELGQTLKGKTKNNRRVPVHPELHRLGLMDYLRSVEKEGPWLFPSIDRSPKRGSNSSAWGAWFGRYLDAVGINDRKLTFHSFRHTFKHHARASGVPEDHQDAMTGHTTTEVARRYGSADGYPVSALAESIRRLRFGMLDLSKVRAA